METIFFIFIAGMLGIIVMLIKYLIGDFNYTETVIEQNSKDYIVQRTYHNTKVVMYKRTIYEK